jgi:hypothetical protein
VILGLGFQLLFGDLGMATISLFLSFLLVKNYKPYCSDTIVDFTVKELGFRLITVVNLCKELVDALCERERSERENVLLPAPWLEEDEPEAMASA